MAIQIGTGSWTDAEYRGVLYPPGLPAGQRLRHYATRFDHVEVNSSYYATPRRAVVEEWAKETPPGFIFQIKLHRAISQNPAKAAEGDLPARILHSAQPLIEAGKLGSFLLVLPPSFGPEKHSLEELDALAEKLRPCRLAVELRDNGWVKGPRRERAVDHFRARQLVWVNVDMPKIKGSAIMPDVDEVTHPDLAYFRLHGRNPGWLEAKSAEERHRHEYTARQLDEIAARVQTMAAAAAQVCVVANNHARDYAPKAALALQERLGPVEDPA